MSRRLVELSSCQHLSRANLVDDAIHDPAVAERQARQRSYPRALLGTRHIMTTQTSFDLSGLIHSIESYNSGYQIALYAEHAQVQIIDRDQSEQAPRIVSGRPAIAQWIEDMAAPDIVHHIVD